MYVKFDSLNRFEVPQMFLCNPGSIYRDDNTLSSVVGILHNTSDEEIVFNFNATSELNLRVYNVQCEDPDENAQMIKSYTALQNRRMIFVDNIGFFVITNVVDGTSEGKDYKDISASSCEIEIQYKNIPYIEDGTYQFTQLCSTLVGMLPLWTVGSIDSKVASKYRTFEGVAEDKNILGFLMEDMQDAYECIFVFDTIKREINVYDQNNFVIQTPIHLTKEDLINTIEVVESSEDLYTAISVLGNENLNIAAINPLGTNTIYNFDYYLDWMSTGLKTKVINWQALIKDKFDEHYNLNLEYYQLLTNQNNEKFEMDKLQAQITMYTRCKENMVASGNTLIVESYNELIVSEGGTAITVYPEISQTVDNIQLLIQQAETEYKAAENRYNAYNTQLNALRIQINNIQTQVAIDKYFSQSEYAELYNYIFEGNYHDEYITTTESMTFAQRFEQMKTLYDRSVSQLEKVSKPTQKFSVGLENFIFVKDFEEWSNLLTTGCLLNIELKENDVAALFLSTIAINYDDKALDFTFGNRFNKYDPKSLFKDALGNIKKSSNSISYIKDIIYPIKEGKFDEVSEAIKNSRNLTKNAVLASRNEEVVIDEYGYTGRSVDSHGDIDPRQIKITGKNIVFTKDAWDTCDVAIGEIILKDNSIVYGVNAETIIGNLIFGNQLIIKNDDESMTFGEEGLVVTNGNNQVVLSPKDDESIFSIRSNNNNLLFVNADGVLSVTGHITATSLTLGNNANIPSSNVSGLSAVATSGQYKDLLGQPTIPTKVTDLTGGKNVVYTDDVKVVKTSTANGITTQSIQVGGITFDYIDSGDFVLLGQKYGTDSTDGSKSYTYIQKDGLLTAKNALIYGTVYATNGSFTGKIYANEGEIGGFTLLNNKLSVSADAYVDPVYIDARNILRHTANQITLGSEAQKASDINKDGKITAIDARWALQIINDMREYSNCAGAIKGNVIATIDPTNCDNLISLIATNPWGTSVSTRIGTNGILTPKLNTYSIAVNGSLISAEQVILYQNNSGTAGTVTLSESVQDFDWLYIVVGDDTTGQTGSSIVFLPDGKTVNISANTSLIDGVDIKSVSYTISGASMTLNSNRQSKLTNNTWAFNNNALKCKYVIGFRGAGYAFG